MSLKVGLEPVLISWGRDKVTGPVETEAVIWFAVPVIDVAPALVNVTEDQQSLAIGKGGQNVRLAAKLTGWKIDIQPAQADGTQVEAEKADEGRSEDSK